MTKSTASKSVSGKGSIKGRTGWTFLVGFILLAPIFLAVVLVHQAYNDKYFGERIAYLSHLSPDSIVGALNDSNEVGDILQFVGNEGVPVRRFFLSALPETIIESPTAERKQMFTATVLPLVLRVNELIMEDRSTIITLQEKLEAALPLNPYEEEWLLNEYQSYGLEALTTDDIDFEEFLTRVDIIPPSLAMAQAAIESGWGTSRFAQLGNALYGQWIWGDGDTPGIIPEGREEGETHRIRAFDYLIQSVRGYAKNLNTHPAYADLRTKRKANRDQGQAIQGMTLATTLDQYSTRREEYVDDLQTIIRTNDFSQLDDAQLEPSWWSATNR